MALHQEGMVFIDDVACYFASEREAEASNLGSVWLRAKEGTRARAAQKANQVVEAISGT